MKVNEEEIMNELVLTKKETSKGTPKVRDSDVTTFYT